MTRIRLPIFLVGFGGAVFLVVKPQTAQAQIAGRQRDGTQRTVNSVGAQGWVDRFKLGGVGVHGDCPVKKVLLIKACFFKAGFKVVIPTI
jgi:hypothetical protein